MSFDNKYFIGVTRDGYHVTLPIQGQISDEDAVELAALIVAMKPANRVKFEERLRDIE